MFISISSNFDHDFVVSLVSEQIMVQKIDTELEHGKSEEKEVGALEKDKNNNNINNVTNVEFHVSISEPKEQNLDLKAETENKGIEQNPVCWRDEEDVEVNIIGNSGLKSVEDNYVDLDETESSSSSSFGDTGSGLDTGSDSAFSDSDEVQSPVSEEWNELRRLRYVSDSVSIHCPFFFL